ncbi:MAG TPA: ferritin [Geobacter sp.]|nr:ferritin [Geobacter sp.]
MDVFDFAMKMELQGKACYESLAASTQVPGLKTIFTGLAADEQKHYDILRGLKEGKEWSMTESRMLDRAKSVVGELLSDKERLSDLKEDLDGYKLGLKVEAESVKLYEDMAKKEQDPETLQLYLRLANEEKKHYNIIENICDFVMRPKYYLEWREFSNLHEL